MTISSSVTGSGIKFFAASLMISISWGNKYDFVPEIRFLGMRPGILNPLDKSNA